MRTFSDLIDEIEKSKGKDIHLKLNSLVNTNEILNRNFFSLFKLKKYIVLNVQIMGDRDKIDNFQIEFARHLHNYLSSVKTLLDHTRTLKRKLKLDTTFENKYIEQQKKIISSDTISFIQQLREYVQHYELLPTGVEVSVQDGNEKVTLVLTTSKLREFSSWSPASLRILDKNLKNIEVFNLIEEYQALIARFYEWFYREVESIFASDLESLGN